MCCCRNLEKLDLPVYSVQAHREIINAIDGVAGLSIGDGAPEICTAGRDGILQLYFCILNLFGVSFYIV